MSKCRHRYLRKCPQCNNKPSPTRCVEYYRLWGGDYGAWDTDFIDIPADTPDDKMDIAIRQAVAKIPWSDEPPMIVGFYGIVVEEENETEENDAKTKQPS